MPTKEEIKSARLEAGLTQDDAGKLLGFGWKYWQQWEYGKRVMRDAYWELFLIKSKALRRKHKEK